MNHDLSWLDLLPDAAKTALAREITSKLAQVQLEWYRPYAKQREFHRAGASYRERLFMAGNQLGKTLAGGAEDAIHATGRYPSWWDGRVFRKPTVGWVAGVTGELTRDGPQRVLMGRPNAIGTGMLPKDAIKDYSMKRGVADAIDTVIIRHGGGGDVQAGESIRTFKSYDSGESKFQSETLDTVSLDEEPPIKVYTEALTRTNTTNGIVWLTFTPLKGMSDVVMRFLKVDPLDPARLDRHTTKMGIAEAEHYTPEERARIIASYPVHERNARAYGDPILGSGKVYPIEESQIKVKAFPIPSHWPRLAAMDFGWDHYTAVVWLAWDRDNDVIYVTDCIRMRREEAAVPLVASAIKSRGLWIPVAWPHDGENETAQGPQLAGQYRREGVNMRHENAKFPETNDDSSTNTKQSRTSVEAGVQDIYSRMLKHQFKVFDHLEDWFEEFRLYHRKDGKIVKLRDDALSATRYGVMDIRFAITQPVATKINPNRPVSWRT